jgi:hypothetical protein
MKHFLFWVGLLCAASVVRADTLPIITAQPTNQVVSPGGTAKFSVTATAATAFQWRFNGSDIANETNALLQISNVQTNNAGYYLVIVKNSTGWVPSKLVYLATALPIFDDNEGVVPFSNTGIPSAQAKYQYGYGTPSGSPIAGGMATVAVGPQLDQMKTVPFYTASISNGYFNGIAASAPSVMPGQTVYYRVDITYTNGGQIITQPSTILKLIATQWPDLPDASNLKFPGWLEWPYDPHPTSATPTNQIRIPGETFTLTNDFYASGDYGVSTGQWRKDGVLLSSGTNFFQPPPVSAPGYGTFRAILTISNVQPSDAGVYDVQVLGNNWIIGPKTSLNVQTANGWGVFATPRSDGSNFLADLQGIAGRIYQIQWSSNLSDWNALQTISNVTGTITISNAPADPARFYRALLLP